MAKQRIIILGGGFGGVYTALGFERALRRSLDVEVLLVNDENFFLFTPMLHEVASGELDPTSIVSPLHKLFDRVQLFCGQVQSIDVEKKTVTLTHGDAAHSHDIGYDHLVLALGCESKFFGLPGVAEHALSMRSLGDAMRLRNRVIAMLEEANFDCSAAQRDRLLTFVVAGGGFAGVETVAGVHGFVHEIIRHYENIKHEKFRVLLVHSSQTLLPELDAALGAYTGKLLQSRGVEVLFCTRVAGFDGSRIQLNNGTSFEAGTLVWTAGNGAHPLLEKLPLPMAKGRIKTDEFLRVENFPGIWALGDCAYIPCGPDESYPPTAQHALREGKLLAANIQAQLTGKALKPFHFKMLGQLASLGRRHGVAQVFGFRFSGFIAWWLWRTIYLMKLPRFEKKVRVALDWTLDMIFSKDFVQLPK